MLSQDSGDQVQKVNVCPIARQGVVFNTYELGVGVGYLVGLEAGKGGTEQHQRHLRLLRVEHKRLHIVRPLQRPMNV